MITILAFIDVSGAYHGWVRHRRGMDGIVACEPSMTGLDDKSYYESVRPCAAWHQAPIGCCLAW